MDSPRFSFESNLMNYSIPKSESALFTEQPSEISFDRREIQRGNEDTRIRQLEAQVEQLTLQNVKLQRMNRLLKIDADKLLEESTDPLFKKIEKLTISNIKLQRTCRLLSSQLEEQSERMNNMYFNQIKQMKNVGPEYEFLVQNINLLQRQIAGHPACDETCCFTMKPIDQSNMVMTMPDQNQSDEEIEAQHICRPVIHSSISQGSYAVELESKIQRLEQLIEEQDQEKEQVLRQQALKENDLETLKRELRIKDDIVSQLEQDFVNLEDQIVHLHKTIGDSTMRDNLVITPPPIITELLMQSKRRSLAIKDPELLLKTESSNEEEDTDSSRSSSPSNTAVMYLEDKKVKRQLLKMLP